MDPDSPEPVNLGAEVQNAERADADGSFRVRLLFWADLARIYATANTEFKIWYGDIVGSGRILAAEEMPDAEPRLAFDLDEDERRLLMAGLADWGGPSRCTNAMALAMGFGDVESLFREGRRLREYLRFDEPMSGEDWARSLLATEVCFASSLGSTIDWEITTGFADSDTIQLIRSLQRKLVSVTNAIREDRSWPNDSPTPRDPAG